MEAQITAKRQGILNWMTIYPFPHCLPIMFQTLICFSKIRLNDNASISVVKHDPTEFTRPLAYADLHFNIVRYAFVSGSALTCELLRRRAAGTYCSLDEWSETITRKRYVENCTAAMLHSVVKERAGVQGSCCCLDLCENKRVWGLWAGCTCSVAAPSVSLSSSAYTSSQPLMMVIKILPLSSSRLTAHSNEPISSTFWECKMRVWDGLPL